MTRWPRSWTHWPATKPELIMFVPLIAILAAIAFVTAIGIGTVILELIP